MTPAISPCKCGATPTFSQSQKHGINILRMECVCGKRGATLMFTKPEDETRTRQAGIDGWNLAG